jgi:tetraacyldisaccharide 4'-kinase
MIRIKKKIESAIMSADNNGKGCFLSLLSIASKVYGGAVRLRRTFYKRSVFKSKKLSRPVISIGNVTAGGTGKTPMTIYVANVVKALGYNVAVVSRGYKGKAEKMGGIVSDGETLLMAPEVAGDEPYMLAARLKGVPVIVGKNRFKAGRLAIRKFAPDIIILDDGFQHLKLERDLDLVLLDCRQPLGNGHLLPRGMMREPASSLCCADAIVLTRADMANNKEMTSLLQRFRFHERKKPVFRAFHKPIVYKIINENKNIKKASRQSRDCMKGCTVFAFSGLADNHNFRRTLEDLECNVAGHFEFSDHYSYSDSDLNNIVTTAEKRMSECLVTTEKDYVRIAHKITWPNDLYVIGIEIEFDADAERFNGFIRDRLRTILKIEKPIAKARKDESTKY